MSNYINELINNVNIANNNIIQDNNIIPNNNIIQDNNIIPNNNIINNDNQPLIFYGPNGNVTINELRNQLRNQQDWIRMKTYVLTSIDYILFQTRSPNAQHINGYVDELNNQVNTVNNMIFLPNDQYILYMIINIVNNSTRNQKKEIYNLFSNLN